MSKFSEPLRKVMRQWPSGVAIASSQFESKIHGMTVNSFNSISLNPPLVTVTLANDTRTHDLVAKSGYFGISILNHNQQLISERFAGKVSEQDNRFDDLQTFTLLTGSPFIADGIGFLDCQVVHKYLMASSTLFVGKVLAAQYDEENHNSLVYFNRGYYKISHD